MCAVINAVVCFCVFLCGWYCVYASAVGLVVKYLVANEMPRVRFPDGAFSYAARLAASRKPRVRAATSYGPAPDGGVVSVQVD